MLSLRLFFFLSSLIKLKFSLACLELKWREILCSLKTATVSEQIKHTALPLYSEKKYLHSHSRLKDRHSKSSFLVFNFHNTVIPPIARFQKPNNKKKTGVYVYFGLNPPCYIESGIRAIKVRIYMEIIHLCRAIWRPNF